MPLPTQDRRYTYCDYLAFPDDGQRYELVDGEVFVSPSPLTRHQHVLGELTFALRSWMKEGGGGQLYFAPFDVVLSERDVVQPDLVWFAPRHLDRIAARGCRGAPTLVVEVLSPTTRRLDVVRKRALYAAHGVEEYWLIDPEIDAVTVLRREGAGLVTAGELGIHQDGVLTSGLLPGFELARADLFPPPAED